MSNYNLTALLKLRQLEKENAERSLQRAHKELVEEQNKLALLKEQLAQKKLDRTQMHDNFFHKALTSPRNKHEVNCLALSAKKNIWDESSLKNLVHNQYQHIKNAELRYTKAHEQALTAHQDYKAITKHHSLWQRKEKRREELLIQDNADEQNSVRFWLKKRAQHAK